MRLKFKTEVNSSLERAKTGFNRDLFLQLKPPFMQVILDRFDGCEVGHEVHLRTGIPGLLQPWVSLITEASVTPDSWFFVDEGKRLPFPLKNWRHRHEVKKTSNETSEILDEIEYSSGIRLVAWSIGRNRDTHHNRTNGDAII